MKLFQFVAALLAAAVAVNAAPANPEPQTYYQPDGAETPLVYLKGNQLYNWLVDEKGYTVVRDEQGWYNYGMKTEDGDIVSSGVKLGSKNPKKVGIAPGLMHDEHKRPANFLGDNSAESVREHRSLLHVPENALCGFAGSKDDPCRLRSLVFLVKFSDHSDRILPAKEDYDLLFNNNGADDDIAPSGSVRDVFFENSYGTFILESYVTPWLAVTRTEVQTVDDYNGLNRPGTKATWKEAIGMFDDMNLQDLNSFDEDEDGFFDCVVILHSGSPAEVGGIDCENNKDKNGRIWSHATQFPLYETAGGITTVKRFYVASAVFGSCPDAGPFTEWNIARIAVIAHECAHFLGLPDLYDTDGGQGIGTFDLMANMWGWYGNQWYPPLMGAWSKLKLGWTNVVHVAGAETHKFMLGPACTHGEILYIDHRLKDGEYFLVEYRYPCGFDAELSHHSIWTKDRSGGAIWHIDESGLQNNIGHQSQGIPANGESLQHYQVALVQGDGNFNMERAEGSDGPGGNKGDRTDLFMNCDYNCGKAKKIDNSGTTKADGQFLVEPSTRGYAGGQMYDTGITIEVGGYAATMEFTITLEGDDPEPNTFPGIDKSTGDSPGTDSSTGDPPGPDTPAPSSFAPSTSPSNRPTVLRSDVPSASPSDRPSKVASQSPSRGPSSSPSYVPSSMPSVAPSTSASNRPTVVRSDVPSPAPSDRPSKVASQSPSGGPSSSPSDVSSSMPSLAPSTSPSNRPTVMRSEVPSPAPSTPAPVELVGEPTYGFTDPEMKHNELEDEDAWEAKFGTHDILDTDDAIAAYKEHYEITDSPDHYTDLTEENTQTELLNIPINCQKRDNQFIVSYKGIGRNPTNPKVKHCEWFKKKNTKFCPLLDLDVERSKDGVRARIWQVCQQECSEYTGCNNKA